MKVKTFLYNCRSMNRHKSAETDTFEAMKIIINSIRIYETDGERIPHGACMPFAGQTVVIGLWNSPTPVINLYACGQGTVVVLSYESIRVIFTISEIHPLKG